MFAVKRNQVIITALVMMIAVAGYLNHVDQSNLAPQEVAFVNEGEVSVLVPDWNNAVSIEDLAFEEGDIAVTHNTEIVAESIEVSVERVDGEATEAGAAVFVNTTTDNSFFIQARLSREQSRSRQKTLLLEMINNDNIEQAHRSEAASAMLTIQERIEKETATESMIESRGFREVYVRIDDSTVDIVVNKAELTEAETAQIEDIVKRKTGMAANQIRISTLRN